MAPARCIGLLAITPTARPSMRANAVTRPGANDGRSSRTDPSSASDLDRPPDVVDAPPVRRHHVPQPLLIGRRPVPHVPLEVRQVPAGHLDGFLLIGAEDIDDPVRHLHRDRADLFRAVDAQPATLDHGRAPHADVGVGSGDDDVAASEERGVAGEAASRHHADERHLPAQRAEEREGLRVEPGHHGHVRVARTAAAALGEEHHGEAQSLHELEEAVLLAVVHLALGAGQDGIVVRQHGAAGPFVVEEVAVDPPDAGHQAVGRRVGDEVLGAAARPLGGDDEAAVLLEAVGVAEVLDVLPRRAAPAGVATFGGGRTTRRRGCRRRGPRSSASSGRTTLGCSATASGAVPSPSDSDSASRLRPRRSTAARPRPARRRPTDTATARTVPAAAASTTCSIFMDSSTTSTAPAAHLVAGSDVHAEHGAGERHRELGQPSHRGVGHLEADVGAPGVAVRDLVHRAALGHAPGPRRVAEADRAREHPALVLGHAEDLEGLGRVEELQQCGQAAPDALGAGGQHGVPHGGVDGAARGVVLAEREQVQRHRLEVVGQPLGRALHLEHLHGVGRLGVGVGGLELVLVDGLPELAHGVLVERGERGLAWPGRRPTGNASSAGCRPRGPGWPHRGCGPGRRGGSGPAGPGAWRGSCTALRGDPYARAPYVGRTGRGGVGPSHRPLPANAT